MKGLRAHDYAPQAFPDEQPVLLTATEAARELRCSKTHLHNIIYGKVPYLPSMPVLHIGRRLLIRRDALREWMLAVEARETEDRKASGLFH